MEKPKTIGNYQIIEIIGRGGMGCVYKAYHSQLNRFVALKVILAEHSHQDQKRFFREAKAISKLNHPNIVELYDMGVEGQTPYLVMGLVEGVSLSQFLKQTPIDIHVFARIMLKIAQAVDCAHKHKIIHRDLKPSNVLVEKNGEPKLLDFGLAKFTNIQDSISKTGNIMGTPGYMSPEQAKGEKVNHLSDMYSLGVLLYEMLCGKQMVVAENIAAILFKVVHDSPIPLRQQNPKVALDLEAICEKCIAKKPIERYQSAKEFVDDLTKFLNGELVSAVRITIYKRMLQKIKRYKVPIIIVIIAVLLLIFIVNFHRFFWPKKVHLYLQQSQELLGSNKHSLAAFIQAENYINKARELMPKNTTIDQKLFAIYQQMGQVALKQKEYLLAQITATKMRNLGFVVPATKLVQQTKEKQKKLQLHHLKFIKMAMKNIARIKNKDVLKWYTFQIVKVNKAYIVEMLVPFLQKKNYWQSKLAIRALGKLGNVHTKVEKKNSVTWLMMSLKKDLFILKKDKNIERQVEERIVDLMNALGWLQDSCANELVHRVRWASGYRSNIWQKTIVSYNRIPIKNNVPKNAIEFCLRGQMKQDKKDFMGALADFNKAIRLDPKLSQAYSGRGKTYINQGNTTRALADYAKAIVLDPTNLYAYLSRASIRHDQKDFAGSVADFSKAIQLSPRNAALYNLRGNTYMLTKNLPKAMADYSKAIDINPRLAEAYANRSSVRLLQGDLAGSIADCTQAIEFAPDYVDSYNNRGLARQKQGDFIGAIIDLSKAINLNPKDDGNYFNRGLARVDQKDFIGAIADYSTAIKLNPKFFMYYYARGVAYKTQGNTAKAMADYNKTIAINPYYFNVYNERAILFQEQKKYVAAIADFSKVIQLNPQLAQAYFSRGALYWRAKNPRAFRDFQIFLKLAPNHPASPRVRALLQQYIKK